MPCRPSPAGAVSLRLHDPAQIGPVAVRGYLTTAISGATNVTAPSGKTSGVIDAANQIVSAA